MITGDKNLNSVEQETLYKALIEALKRIRALEKELLALKKRVEILEGP